jgi:hypothetical protein
MNEESSQSSPDDPQRGRRVAAGALLVVAVLALADRHLSLAWRDGMPLLLGVGFVVWAALGRSAGLLVPGGILVGVGVGMMLRPDFGEAAFLFSLAGGFALIPVLSWLIFQRWVCWPVFPAAGVGLAGLVRLAGPELRERLHEYGPLWPYVLILVAVYLLFTKSRPKNS